MSKKAASSDPSIVAQDEASAMALLVQSFDTLKFNLSLDSSVGTTAGTSSLQQINTQLKLLKDSHTTLQATLQDLLRRKTAALTNSKRALLGCRLLGIIPAELRVKIYRYVLVEPWAGIVDCYQYPINVWPPLASEPVGPSSTARPLTAHTTALVKYNNKVHDLYCTAVNKSLLCVSRQLRAEASAVFYHHNTFQMRWPARPTAFDRAMRDEYRFGKAVRTGMMVRLEWTRVERFVYAVARLGRPKLAAGLQQFATLLASTAAVTSPSPSQPGDPVADDHHHHRHPNNDNSNDHRIQIGQHGPTLQYLLINILPSLPRPLLPSELFDLLQPLMDGCPATVRHAVHIVLPARSNDDDDDPIDPAILRLVTFTEKILLGEGPRARCERGWVGVEREMLVDRYAGEVKRRREGEARVVCEEVGVELGIGGGV